MWAVKWSPVEGHNSCDHGLHSRGVITLSLKLLGKVNAQFCVKMNLRKQTSLGVRKAIWLKDELIYAVSTANKISQFTVWTNSPRGHPGWNGNNLTYQLCTILHRFSDILRFVDQLIWWVYRRFLRSMLLLKQFIFGAAVHTVPSIYLMMCTLVGWWEERTAHLLHQAPLTPFLIWFILNVHNIIVNGYNVNCTTGHSDKKIQ